MAMHVDFHSHILPGIDDGSASVEESLAMLRLEGEQGIGHVVATPHFYPHRDSLDHFLHHRAKAAQALTGALETHPELPRFTLGAEVYFFRRMSESAQLRKLTIGKSPYILIEMPPAPWPEELYRELEAVRTRQGLIPVIAHIDRYIGPLRTYNIPQRLAALPVLVQANAEFFLERGTGAMAMKLLKEDRIHLLGSDCHDLTDRRPNLGKAVQRIRQKLGGEALERIRQYEREILEYNLVPDNKEME